MAFERPGKLVLRSLASSAVEISWERGNQPRRSFYGGLRQRFELEELLTEPKGPSAAYLHLRFLTARDDSSLLSWSVSCAASHFRFFVLRSTPAAPSASLSICNTFMHVRTSPLYFASRSRILTPRTMRGILDRWPSLRLRKLSIASDSHASSCFVRCSTAGRRVGRRPEHIQR